MNFVSKDEYNSLKAKSAARKAKREAKATVLWPRKAQDAPRRIRKASPRQGLKSRIIRVLGLLSRKIYGPYCAIHGKPCLGTLAYHIVPAQRGDSVRFMAANVVWACRSANYGEVMNRSLYREKHVAIFGKEFVEHIEAAAREFKHFTVSELRELLATHKTQLEL